MKMGIYGELRSRKVTKIIAGWPTQIVCKDVAQGHFIKPSRCIRRHVKPFKSVKPGAVIFGRVAAGVVPLT